MCLWAARDLGKVHNSEKKCEKKYSHNWPEKRVPYAFMVFQTTQ